jgi:ABC-type glutathione transport system ATPase component
VSTTDPIIDVRGLSKTFPVYQKAGRVRRRREEVEAVIGIDLAIERGAMVGYIGPNGAGKSTTIKMLTGILVPSGGQAALRHRADPGGRPGGARATAGGRGGHGHERSTDPGSGCASAEMT